MVFLRIAAVAAFAAALAWGEDPVAELRHRIETGAVRLPFEGPYGYLPSLLRELRVPAESQMAVFSKTSLQAFRIEPGNPRVLYFNDSVAVGWVREGFIELAAQDASGELRFYVLLQRPDEQITRREDCLNCHKSGTLRLTSVRATTDGIPSGQIEVDNRTPFRELWGGWFVTGAAVPAEHRGNAVFANGERREWKPALPPAVAPQATSDVAALMVFAHQTRVMNLLAHAADHVDELADALLFVDEAPLPSAIRGNSGFAEAFAAAGPRDHLGRSLREFDLERRLMRYRCSYMIYSPAFDGLPAATKELVYRRMSAILSGEEQAERDAIIEILRETKAGLPDWFGRTGSAKAAR